MSRMNKMIFVALSFAVIGCSAAAVTHADPVVITFNELQNGERVRDFYNGGLGSLGSGPGPNFGVSFSSNVTATAGPDAQIFFRPNDPDVPNCCFGVMNSSSGFASQFSFMAASNTLNIPTVIVSIFDGLDGTGSLLAQISGIAPGHQLQPFSLTFNGIGRSVILGGIAGFATFDNIVFTPLPATVVPEPATLLLFGIGMAGLATKVLKRYAKAETHQSS